MRSIAQDLRYGLRTWGKTPGFTIAALLALAIGIGANTAIFSVLYSVILKPLAYKSPDRLVIMWEKGETMEMSVAYPDFLDWRARSQSFESMAAMRRDSFNISGGDRPERVQGRLVSWNFLRTFGADVKVGRDFLQNEDQPGASPAVILSHGLWQRRFGGSPDVIGRPITLNDRQYTIVGVSPPGFKYGDGIDVFTPIELAKKPNWTRGNHPGIYVIGRLKEGVSLDQARAEMDTVAQAINIENTEDGPRSTFTRVVPILENLVEDVKQPLWIMFTAVAFVLLIASSNVANLLLARSTVRQRELAIRSAMGASRGRIFRQLLTESILLSLLGGGAGILLAVWSVNALRAAELTSLPRIDEVSVHPAVLGFTAAVSVLTGLIFGIAPALQASKANLNDLLKEGIRGGRYHSRLRNILITSEIALALVMLVGAGLAVKSLLRLLTTDTGFVPQQMLTLQMTLSPVRYTTGDSATQYLDRVRQELATIPGIEAVAYANGGPLLIASENSIYKPEDNQRDPKALHMTVSYGVSPEYKDALGLRLVKGRFIQPEDRRESARVVVVDTHLAKEMYGGEAIGKRLKYGDPDKPEFTKIVGIVEHVKHYGLDAPGPVPNQMYFSLKQSYRNQLPFFRGEVLLFLRHTGVPDSIIPAIRNKMAEIDPNQPVYNISPYLQVIAQVTETQRLASWLLSLFGVIALLLASIGIYGVMSYSVTQRTHEIGIRMALGARRADVLRMVLGQTVRVTAIGLVIGAVAGLVLTRYMKALLFNVRANDPAIFLLIILILGSVALFASFIPARRATKVDPMVALRYE